MVINGVHVGGLSEGMVMASVRVYIRRERLVVAMN